jgi:hypothetical protein
MSKKNAPEHWDKIATAARACGAGEWAMRKWLERCEIPSAWKIKIFEHTSGAITFDAMEIKASEDAA